MLFASTARQFPGRKAEKDAPFFAQNRKVGLQACGITLRTGVILSSCWLSLSVLLGRGAALCRANVCLHACADRMLYGTEILRLDVLSQICHLSWVLSRIGCMLKMSVHKYVITLFSFIGGSCGGGVWEFRLLQVSSTNLARNRPLILLTGLCGFSKTWAFFLHHLLAWNVVTCF